MIDPTAHIYIRGLKVEAHIGVTQQEKDELQALIVDVDIEADLRAAASSDDVADTIDYAEVVDEVSEIVRTSRFSLLERLGSEIADQMCRHPGVARVTVVLGKESPPVDEAVDAIQVQVIRTTGELHR
ncbi:MAG: dihydroneopterin aldolase [Actinomycetota bacterium]